MGSSLAYSVDEDAGQDQVEDVEPRPPPERDGVVDVDVRVATAIIIPRHALWFVPVQLKLAILLVVCPVPVLVEDRQVQLQCEYIERKCPL